MLAELNTRLESDSRDFGYYQSSNLQGVMMERLDPEYVSLLHCQGINPYSQYLYYDDGYRWMVHTMTEEAYEKIIPPLMSPDFSGFEIKKRHMNVRITEKAVKTLPKRALMDEFYASGKEPFLSFEFLTSTAFKQNGSYVNYPDLRLLFQSLMNKYSAGSDMEMFDRETLEQLTAHASIARYQLRSAVFPLEGVKIPA